MSFNFQHLPVAIWTMKASIKLMYLLSISVKMKINCRSGG